MEPPAPFSPSAPFPGLQPSNKPTQQHGGLPASGAGGPGPASLSGGADPSPAVPRDTAAILQVLRSLQAATAPAASKTTGHAATAAPEGSANVHGSAWQLTPPALPLAPAPFSPALPAMPSPPRLLSPVWPGPAPPAMSAMGSGVLSPITPAHQQALSLTAAPDGAPAYALASLGDAAWQPGSLNLPANMQAALWGVPAAAVPEGPDGMQRLHGGDGAAAVPSPAPPLLSLQPQWPADLVTFATLGHANLPIAPGAAPLLPGAAVELQEQAAAGPPDGRMRAPRRKRARIMREGQLTLILYGANEALTWTRRVAAFLHTMRGVLGDRSLIYTWGGSVLDSIVGVFLTQNVADHLSSKAFMELAARFPPPQRRRQLEEGGGGGDAPQQGANWATHEDSVDWEAVRTASEEALSDAIKCRGMQHKLARDIKEFLASIRQHNLARLRKVRRTQAAEAAAAVQAVTDALLDEVEVQALEGQELGAGAAAPVEAGSAAAAAGHVSASGEGGGRADGCGGPSPKRRRQHIALEYEDDSDSQEWRPGGAAHAASPKYTPASAAPPKPPLGKEAAAARAAALAAGAKEGVEPSAAELLSLEWLREAPDDVAHRYLAGIKGLGRKSVACIMLLELGKKEFPVDTNVGRICARLGWIPLDAEAAVEDLDDYAPEPEVHAYLHSRLLGFDVRTLYELHYQMITLGKVFCNKQQPNCKECPMRERCEYAQNNGPSLHGRKRVRQPAPEYGVGVAPPLLPSDDRRRFFAGGGSAADGGGGGGDTSAHTSSISGGSSSGSDSEEEGSEEVGSDASLGPPPMTRRRARGQDGDSDGALPGPRLGWHGLHEEEEPPLKPTLRQVFAAAMAEARGQRLHWKTLDRLRRLHEEELREGLAAQALDLEELVAATPRRPRTPGMRCPAARFERMQRLRRSREFRQLLAQAGEEEAERLLELGAAARGGGGGRGRPPVAMGRASRRLAALGASARVAPAAVTDRPEPKLEPSLAPEAEEEEEEEDEGEEGEEEEAQEEGSERPARLSPEADRRLARGQRMVVAAGSARMPTRAQHGAPAGGSAGAAVGGAGDSQSGVDDPAGQDAAAMKSAGPASSIGDDAEPACAEEADAGGEAAGCEAAHEPRWAGSESAEERPPHPPAQLCAQPPAQHPLGGWAGPGRGPASASPPIIGSAAGVAHDRASPAAPALVSAAAEGAAPFDSPGTSPCPGSLAGGDVPTATGEADALPSPHPRVGKHAEAGAGVSAASPALTPGVATCMPASAPVASQAVLPAGLAALAEQLSATVASAVRAGGASAVPASLPAALAELAGRGVDVGQVLAAVAARLSAGQQEQQQEQEQQQQQQAGNTASASGASSGPGSTPDAADAARTAAALAPDSSTAGDTCMEGEEGYEVGRGPQEEAEEEYEQGEEMEAGEGEDEEEMDAGIFAGLSQQQPAAAEEEEEEDPPAGEAGAAAAITAAPLRAAAEECERLEGVGHALATAQRSLLVAESRPGADLLPFKLRLVELSLQALGLSAALSEDSAVAVLAAAKRVYRKLSILVHPDRCAAPKAADAFAAASQALQLLAQRAEELRGGGAAATDGAGEGGGGAADAEGDNGDAALTAYQDPAELLRQVVWNENRLALPAALVPPAELAARGLLHPAYRSQYARGSSLGQDPLLFLPLAAVPTLKKRNRHAGAAILAAAASQAAQRRAARQLAAATAAAEPEAPTDRGSGGMLVEAASNEDQGADVPAEPPAAAGAPISVSIPSESAAAPAESGGSPTLDSHAAASGLNQEQGLDPAAEEEGDEEAEENEEEGDAEEEVAGVLLFSARAALRGRFPLNGTYFQVNEVFADHTSCQIPVLLPASLLDSCPSRFVHFGHSIHFMAKGMSQAEVAHMFSHGYCCFKAILASTGGPQSLPEWLQPSIPTKSSTPWKNKEQRDAERAAKAARARGLPPPIPDVVRWLRVPLDGEAGAPLPAVLPLTEFGRQDCGLEEYLELLPGRKDALAELASPTQRGKKRGAEGDDWEGAPRGGAAPHSQEARDAKSGRGKRRLFLHPVIRSNERCGDCSACRNPHWKKACMTRRAEQEAKGL